MQDSHVWKPKVRAWIKLQHRKSPDSDEYVLLYPEGRVVLNRTSHDILKLCDGENTVENIIRILIQTYDSNTGNVDIHRDVTKFIYASKDLLWFE